jgi:hypothetical protein
MSAITQDDVIQFYQYSAERGDTVAQWALGRYFFRSSHASPKNVKQAIRYLKMAASKLPSPIAEESAAAVSSTARHASAEATALLGQLYWRGDGVPQSNQTAFKYFRRAAAHGSAIALNGLGLMYLHGIVVKQDPDEAMRHFVKAAEMDHPDALLHIGMILLGKLLLLWLL